MNTDSIHAGRELDVRVAVQVMGFRQVPNPQWKDQIITLPPDVPDIGSLHSPGNVWWLGKNLNVLVPQYSASIALAWMVLQKICAVGFSARYRFYASLQQQASNKSAEHWVVAWPDVLIVLVDDMPGAICRAALEATQP